MRSSLGRGKQEGRARFSKGQKGRPPPCPFRQCNPLNKTRTRAQKEVHVFPVCLEEDGTLYFQDHDGLEDDSWRRSKWCSEPQIFRNIENYILIAKLEGPASQMAVFEDMTVMDKSDEPGIKFTIYSFEDTVPRGQTVALATSKDSKTYCLHAEKLRNGDMQVRFKERNVPERISGEASDIIFFQIPFSEGDDKFFKFESTLDRGYFLAFEKGEGSHARRLIMKRISPDEVDETIKMSHSTE